MLRFVGSWEGWEDGAKPQRHDSIPQRDTPTIRALLTGILRELCHDVGMSPGALPIREGGQVVVAPIAAKVRLKPLLSLWRDHQEADHLDPKYIKASHRNVRLLCIHARQIDLAKVTRPHVLAYRDYLCKKYESGSTVNNHLASIRQFFAWVVDIRELRENPTESVKNAARNDGDGNREFTPTEAERMIVVAREDEASNEPQHGAIRSPSYIVGWNTGLRHIELGRLFKEDVRGLGTADCYLELHWTKTKNRRAVQVPLNPEAQAELAKWLPLIEHPKDLIFDSVFRPGLPQLPHDRVVDRDIAAAGIAKYDEWGAPVGFHSFRKGGATALAAGGAQIEKVSQFLRHSDPKLTQKVYIRLRRKQLGAVSDSVPSVDNHPAPRKTHKEFDKGAGLPDTEGVTHPNTQNPTTSRPRPFGPGCVTNNQPKGPGRGVVSSVSRVSGHLPPSEIAGVGFEPAPATGAVGAGITLNLTVSPEAIGTLLRVLLAHQEPSFGTVTGQQQVG